MVGCQLYSGIITGKFSTFFGHICEAPRTAGNRLEVGSNAIHQLKQVYRRGCHVLP
jgi:hypothetical protein